MTNKRELFIEISNQQVTEGDEVVGYLVKNSRMNELEKALLAPAQPVIPRWPADEVERDALRYRFLRDKDFFGDEDEPGLVGWEELVELSYNEFDAAVDARISHPNIDYVKLDTALRKHIPAQPVSEPKTLPSG